MVAVLVFQNFLKLFSFNLKTNLADQTPTIEIIFTSTGPFSNPVSLTTF